MRRLSRDELLALDDKEVQKLEVPEWNAEIFIRTMTAGCRDVLETAMAAKKPDIRARLAAMTICDEQGALQYSEKDIAALSGKNVKAMNRIFDAAIALNAVDKAGIEEAEKN